MHACKGFTIGASVMPGTHAGSSYYTHPFLLTLPNGRASKGDDLDAYNNVYMKLKTSRNVTS